jgi:AcrR family transcriptional regulator
MFTYILNQYNESKTRHKTRHKLLSQGYQLILENGLQNMSIKELSKKCEIDRATIYRYYNSKESLIQDISFSFLKDKQEKVQNMRIEGENGYEKLAYFLNKFFLENFLTQRDYAFINELDLFQYQNQSSPEVVSQYQTVVPDISIRNSVVELIQEGINDGSIKESTYSSEELASIIFVNLISLNLRVSLKDTFSKSYSRTTLRNSINFFLEQIKK